MLIVVTALTSCYDDYIQDYDYDAIYFSRQNDVRTFVVGESQKIEVGVALGGVTENDRDREVVYSLDTSLINAALLTSFKNGGESKLSYIKESATGLTELKLLPTSYYTISDNSKMVIKQGDHVGTVVITATDAFINDLDNLKSKYVLPFKIESADADTVLESMNYEVVGFKYESLLFGNYVHTGVSVVKDASGGVVSTTAISNVLTLKTVSPNTLETYKEGTAQDASSIKVALQSDGKIVVGNSALSKTDVVTDGDNYYNQAKLLQDRKLFLSYKFANGDGTTTFVKDTLVFRNRIRDGVNEWQDENPENYQ